MRASATDDQVAPPLEVPVGCPTDTASIPAAAKQPGDPRLSGPSLMVVFKGQRRLGHYAQGALTGCWPVGLAMGYPAGHKQREGDLKTPEGWYTTSDKPTSQWYGAIAIHYPNAEDAQAGVADGRITPAVGQQIARAVQAGRKPPQTTALGGEILIHGHGATDWTLGCVGMDNTDLDRLRAQLPSGMKTWVWILP